MSLIGRFSFSCLITTTLTLFVSITAELPNLQAQTFVYSGRNYTKTGRSYAQLRMIDLATGRHRQLTYSPVHKSVPWCTPDGRSILYFVWDEKAVYRLDRTTGKETKLFIPEQHVYQFGALAGSQLLVQQHGAILDVYDQNTLEKVRHLKGYTGTISPDRRLFAFVSDGHIFLANTSDEFLQDLGEGSAPFFLADGRLAYTVHERSSESIEVVLFDTVTNAAGREVFRNSEFKYLNVRDLTISPDFSSKIVDSGTGGYGSSVYYLLRNDGRAYIDGNLHGWSGWSANGLLLYATNGRETAPLDASRQVFVGEIRAFDSKTGGTRPVVKGVSMNQDPNWCPAGPPTKKK